MPVLLHHVILLIMLNLMVLSIINADHEKAFDKVGHGYLF